jgi:hypothetical protein
MVPTLLFEETNPTALDVPAKRERMEEQNLRRTIIGCHAHRDVSEPEPPIDRQNGPIPQHGSAWERYSWTVPSILYWNNPSTSKFGSEFENRIWRENPKLPPTEMT